MIKYTIVKKLENSSLEMIDDESHVIDIEPISTKPGETQEMREQRIAAFYKRCQLLNADDCFWKGEK